MADGEKRTRKPREGWAESILAAGPDTEDWSDWDNLKNDWDETGWTWPEDHPWPDKGDTTPIPSPLVPCKDPEEMKPGDE